MRYTVFNKSNETFRHLAFDLSQAAASAGSSIVAFNLDQQAGGFLGGILNESGTDTILHISLLFR